MGDLDAAEDEALFSFRGNTVKHEYRVIYTQIEDGWIMAQAPELPGAVTQGATMDEARMTIKDAIALLLESYRENAERDIPKDAIHETLLIETGVS